MCLELSVQSDFCLCSVAGLASVVGFSEYLAEGKPFISGHHEHLFGFSVGENEAVNVSVFFGYAVQRCAVAYGRPERLDLVAVAVRSALAVVSVAPLARQRVTDFTLRLLSVVVVLRRVLFE